MDVYLSDKEARKVLEEMEKDNQFPTVHLPKEFMFDKIIMNHSKKRYNGVVMMKEGETINEKI